MVVSFWRDSKKMREIQLKNGESVPIIGLGTWRLQGEECADMVSIAYDIGYRHFDTASFYENHRAIATALKDKPRSSYFLTSKLWHDEMGDLAEQALDRTLEELETDYLDLYLIHWPFPREKIVETFKQFTRFQEMGKVRSIGVSNFTMNHLKMLHDEGLYPVMNQVEFHPLLYQKDLLSYCEDYDIALTAYSPLARGQFATHPIISSIGTKYRKPAHQIMLSWLFSKNIIAIPKASTKEHLCENMSSLNVSLSREDLHLLDHIGEFIRITDPDCGDFGF